jgi:hypothetical protein
VDREPFATFNFKYRSLGKSLSFRLASSLLIFSDQLAALKALRVIDDHHEDEVAELLKEMP